MFIAPPKPSSTTLLKKLQFNIFAFIPLVSIAAPLALAPRSFVRPKLVSKVQLETMEFEDPKSIAPPLYAELAVNTQLSTY